MARRLPNIWRPASSIAEITRDRAPDAVTRAWAGSRELIGEPRLPLAEEARVRAEMLKQFERDRRDRARPESTRSKERRLFWEAADRAVEAVRSPAERDRIAREAAEDREAEEIERALADDARARVEAACASWPDDTSWN